MCRLPVNPGLFLGIMYQVTSTIVAARNNGRNSVFQ